MSSVSLSQRAYVTRGELLPQLFLAGGSVQKVSVLVDVFLAGQAQPSGGSRISGEIRQILAIIQAKALTPSLETVRAVFIGRQLRSTCSGGVFTEHSLAIISSRSNRGVTFGVVSPILEAIAQQVQLREMFDAACKRVPNELVADAFSTGLHIEGDLPEDWTEPLVGMTARNQSGQMVVKVGRKRDVDLFLQHGPQLFLEAAAMSLRDLSARIIEQRLICGHPSSAFGVFSSADNVIVTTALFERLRASILSEMGRAT